MKNGIALRNISKLDGKSFKAGDVIPAESLAKMTPQAQRALVNNHDIEIPGMEADAHGSTGQHLRAKLDQQEGVIKAQAATIATQQASLDDLAKRVSDLEAGAAKPAPVSRRQARASGPKE